MNTNTQTLPAEWQAVLDGYRQTGQMPATLPQFDRDPVHDAVWRQFCAEVGAIVWDQRLETLRTKWERHVEATHLLLQHLPEPGSRVAGSTIKAAREAAHLSRADMQNAIAWLGIKILADDFGGSTVERPTIPPGLPTEPTFALYAVVDRLDGHISGLTPADYADPEVRLAQLRDRFVARYEPDPDLRYLPAQFVNTERWHDDLLRFLWDLGRIDKTPTPQEVVTWLRDRGYLPVVDAPQNPPPASKEQRRAVERVEAVTVEQAAVTAYKKFRQKGIRPTAKDIHKSMRAAGARGQNHVLRAVYKQVDDDPDAFGA